MAVQATAAAISFRLDSNAGCNQGAETLRPARYLFDAIVPLCTFHPRSSDSHLSTLTILSYARRPLCKRRSPVFEGWQRSQVHKYTEDEPFQGESHIPWRYASCSYWGQYTPDYFNVSFLFQRETHLLAPSEITNAPSLSLSLLLSQQATLRPTFVTLDMVLRPHPQSSLPPSAPDWCQLCRSTA